MTVIRGRPIFASGFGGFGGTSPAKQAGPPAGWSNTPGTGLVPTTWTDANGVAQSGYMPSFVPDIATEAFSPEVIAKAAETAIPSVVNLDIGSINAPVLDMQNFAVSASGQSQSIAADGPAVNDYRIRLSPIVTAEAFTEVLGAKDAGNLLNPLYATAGMLFPYAPQITVSQDVAYQDVTPVHSNMDYLAYQRTASVQISLSGKFTVQNQIEGAYALACLHFLRTVSKMYFGENPATKRGTPPPILVLNGYGTYMFNNLRVVLKSHTYTYPETMDTVLVKTAGGTARLPALFDLALTLVVQQTPAAMRKVFNLDSFRTGALLRSTTGGWI